MEQQKELELKPCPWGHKANNNGGGIISCGEPSCPLWRVAIGLEYWNHRRSPEQKSEQEWEKIAERWAGEIWNYDSNGLGTYGERHHKNRKAILSAIRESHQKENK